MPKRSYVKLSYGRNLNPQASPLSIDSISDFKKQSTITHSNITDKITMRPIKRIKFDVNEPEDVNLNSGQPTQIYNYFFDNSVGASTPINSYAQPVVSSNYIVPNGLISFDERLSVDYIDKAVKLTEDNAYLAQIFSQNAHNASHDARFDAERASFASDLLSHHHYVSRKP